MKLAVTGSRILVLRALQKAANAAVAIVIMQGLGPVGNGRYSLTVTIVTVLAAVLAGGVGLASVPFLRRQTPAPWRVHRAQLLWFAVVAGVLVLAVGAVRSTSVWTWLQRELTWNEILLACAAATVLAMLVFETANYSLLAAGRVVQGTAVAAIRTLVLMAVLGTILVLGRLQFAVAFLVFALFQIAAAVILLGSSRRAIRAMPGPGPESDPPGYRGLLGTLLRRGWLGQLSALSYLLLLRLDQFFLEANLDTAAVGLYAAAVWGAELLWLVPEALNPLLVHSSADDRDAGRDLTAARAVRLGLGLTALAAIPLALAAGPLLGLLRDGAYLPAVTPLQVLLPGVIAFAPGAVLAGDFIGRGRPHWNTQASVVTVAANVTLCLLWIPRFGILGAAWASTVAYALGSVIMLLRFRQVTGLSWHQILLPRPADLRH